ncbi:MAG: LCP family protein [Chloroflexota bacterium]
MQDDRERVREKISPIQRLFTGVLLVLFIVISAVAGLFVFDQVRRYIAASDSPPPFTSGPENTDPETATPDLTSPSLVWQGKERVNVLVMGIDQRPGEEGAFRTDTMMVLTLDPVSKTAGMLSIPRDLWVPIPGYGVGRINTAHVLGQLNNHPGGGPALAVETVEANLGIPIHYHVRVDFNAFVEVIDRLGGIDITVAEEIDDPKYPSHDPADPYGYDPLHIEAGQHHFDGEMALKYARTRHSSGGDFDRAERQQEVLKSVFAKVTRVDMLSTLLAQAPQMWSTFQGSVETDLTLDKIVALARLTNEIDEDNVRTGIIDEESTLFYETEDGQQVLIPVRDKMRELRDELFTSTAYSDDVEDDRRKPIEEEAATIEVLNGTLRPGLAADVADILREGGLRVNRTGNAERQDVQESLVVAHAEKLYTAQYVAELLDLPESAIVPGYEPGAEYDVSVVLGADYGPVQ